jgi:hypothetical protein
MDSGQSSWVHFSFMYQGTLVNIIHEYDDPNNTISKPLILAGLNPSIENA